MEYPRLSVRDRYVMFKSLNCFFDSLHFFVCRQVSCGPLKKKEKERKEKVFVARCLFSQAFSFRCLIAGWLGRAVGSRASSPSACGEVLEAILSGHLPVRVGDLASNFVGCAVWESLKNFCRCFWYQTMSSPLPNKSIPHDALLQGFKKM